MENESQAGEERSLMGDQQAAQMKTDAAVRLEKLQADPDWMSAYLGGDKVKVAEFRQLNDRVHAHDPAVDLEANREHFPVPRTPEEYRIAFDDEDAPVEQKIELAKEFSETLLAEDVPMNVVNLGREIARRNGMLDDTALAAGRTRGLADLERIHGKAEARKLLIEAKAIFERIAARSERLAHLVDTSGMGSSPHFIETLVRSYRVRQGRG